jgi:hypothetical protein
MKYALTVPFMERIFDLAVQGAAENGYQGGFTGQITSNSFMKREFGKKLIESYIPRWDLTHVIDDAKFDNPRAVQIRLSAFDFDRLCEVGRKVRDVYAMHANSPDRLASKAGDAYIDELARAVTGRLGGKVGVAPRIFLKKLVADILDRVDQFPDFDPHQHYKLTIQDTELTPTERHAAAATSVDEIELT